MLRARAPLALQLLERVPCASATRRECLAYQSELSRRLFPTGEVRVLGGPFAGMRYFNRVVWGPIAPKWLGTYEMELHGVMAQVCSRRYDSVVDIGSAEGYYAVGLALKFPQAVVCARDVDYFARRDLRALARLNGVRNLVVGGRIGPAELGRYLVGTALVVCDIEGAELGLLDAAATPGLAGADILVECHWVGAVSPSEVARVIRERFSASHVAECIAAEPRRTAELAGRLPEVTGLTVEELANACSEARAPGQVWLWLSAR